MALMAQRTSSHPRTAAPLLATMAALVAGLFLAAGCGDVTTSAIDAIGGTDVPSVALKIQGASSSVAPGGTVKLTVNATTKSGAAAADGTRVSFAHSPALGTLSATSATTSAGRAEVTFTAGTQTGKTTVSATAGKATAEFTITVEQSTSGGGSGGSGGGGSSADEIPVSEVTWLHTSPASFTVTASLGNIAISGKTISWTWSQPGWPVEYGNGVLGNMWVFAKINGRWYAATWEWLRASTNRVTLEAKSGEPPFIQSKKGPINAWYPQSGEEIGFMASTPCRDGIPSGSPRQRSPIVKTRWP